MADFTIKQNDTRPYLVAALQDNNAAINLTSATSVKFIMRQQGSIGAPKISSAATFLDRPTGQVQYAWVASNTDTVGDFNGEFEITWNDGGIETVPNDGYFTISIVDDLG